MLKFSDPWEIPVNSEALENQFSGELDTSHYLYKFRNCVKAIAKRSDCDDVLFEIREMGYVLVHLTWSKQNSSKYPLYKVFPREVDVQIIIDEEHASFIGY